MSCLFTVVQTLPNKMLNFLEHPTFEKEYKDFDSKYHAEKDLRHLKKIFLVQFDPIAPKPAIGPGKLHRVKICTNSCEIWKVEMAVRGLRQNQSPRIWFAVMGNTIAFLTIRTHVSNYDNNEVDAIAENLSTEIF